MNPCDPVYYRTPADEAMENEESKIPGAEVSDSAEALERLLEFMTAGFRSAKRRIDVRAATRAGVSNGAEELIKFAEDTAAARSRDVCLRALSVAWVCFPGLLEGESLTAVSARFGVSKQLFDYYVQMFCQHTGLRGRGQKSALASVAYAAAAKGNSNRRRKTEQESRVPQFKAQEFCADSAIAASLQQSFLQP